MSHSKFSKYQASLSIEELFEQPYHQQQKWLLTYLDVFVLIVMLVITLLAISEFKTKQPIETQTISKKTKAKPINIDINGASPDKPILTQSIEKQDFIYASGNKESLKNKQQSKNQHSDESLQQQLAKTVAELGLKDTVNLKVTQGYAQLEIQDKILFKSSDAKLVSAGGALLKKLVPLLEQSSGLIYIEGHTDNRPIKTLRFPSNWELGAARATSVLHYLASQKLAAARLRAITFGDTKPIADNSTTQGREKNRRVSLVLKVSDKID